MVVFGDSESESIQILVADPDFIARQVVLSKASHKQTISGNYRICDTSVVLMALKELFLTVAGHQPFACLCVLDSGRECKPFSWNLSNLGIISHPSDCMLLGDITYGKVT